MLTIRVPARKGFDESTETFVDLPERTIEMEHSLVSLSKWESIWEVPFLDKNEKTPEQVASYILCMILTPDVPGHIIHQMTDENLSEIQAYISAKRTAAWFREETTPDRTRQVVTSDLIYYWMSAAQIDFAAENWHLNRLLTLIKIHGRQNEDPKKKKTRMTADDYAARRELNAARRAAAGHSG